MATLPMQLIPFPVPTEVTLKVPSSGKREDGFSSPISIPISSLSSEVLEAMLAEFCEAVMNQRENNYEQYNRNSF